MRPGPVLAVCLNPVIQKTLVLERLARGAVNRAVEQRTDASGKGVNVCRVLAETGREALHLCQAGGADRDWFLDLCRADGLRVEWVESGSDIRFCCTLVDRERGRATEIVEEAGPVAPGTGAAVLERFRALIPSCRALVLSGSRAPGFPEDMFALMTREARAAGLLVVLDLRGRDLLACLPEGPQVVKPNLEELLATVPPPPGAGSRKGGLREHVRSLALEWKERYGADLVVTRGSRATWFLERGRLRGLVPEPRRSLNPTGSGDAFAAGLTAALLEGAGLAEAVAYGNELGGRNAETLKPGSTGPALGVRPQDPGV